MIDANKEIFRRLDVFCAQRGASVQNAGRTRWIASSKKHHHFMKTSQINACFTVGMSKKIVRIDLVEKSYYAIIGFEHSSRSYDGVEVQLEASHLTVLLSEVNIRPPVSPFMIKDIIEYDDKDANPSYKGHEFNSMSQLFPKIRILEYRKLSEDEMWGLMFRLCLDECALIDSWIDNNLQDTLFAMCDLDPAKIPYRVLCRSIFDSDPANFFLGLYRCLEALYAFANSSDLAIGLGINRSWVDIAVVLENQLGWHPREEHSLERLLVYAAENDLRSVTKALGENESEITSDRIVMRAAKKIYWLRNSIVHFRPAQHRLVLESYDWNVICRCMAGIVLDVNNQVRGC